MTPRGGKAIERMSRRTRTLFILALSSFAGWLATYLVDWGVMAEAALAGGVTLIVFVILLVVVPKGR
jgi:hypothetical protein